MNYPTAEQALERAERERRELERQLAALERELDSTNRELRIAERQRDQGIEAREKIEREQDAYDALIAKARGESSALTLTLDEATAVVSAAFGEDRDALTFDRAINRLSLAVDTSLGLANKEQG